MGVTMIDASSEQAMPMKQFMQDLVREIPLAQSLKTDHHNSHHRRFPPNDVSAKSVLDFDRNGAYGGPRRSKSGSGNKIAKNKNLTKKNSMSPKQNARKGGSKYDQLKKRTSHSTLSNFSSSVHTNSTNLTQSTYSSEAKDTFDIHSLIPSSLVLVDDNARVFANARPKHSRELLSSQSWHSSSELRKLHRANARWGSSSSNNGSNSDVSHSSSTSTSYSFGYSPTMSSRKNHTFDHYSNNPNNNRRGMMQRQTSDSCLVQPKRSVDQGPPSMPTRRQIPQPPPRRHQRSYDGSPPPPSYDDDDDSRDTIEDDFDDYSSCSSSTNSCASFSSASVSSVEDDHNDHHDLLAALLGSQQTVSLSGSKLQRNGRNNPNPVAAKQESDPWAAMLGSAQTVSLSGSKLQRENHNASMSGGFGGNIQNPPFAAASNDGPPQMVPRKGATNPKRNDAWAALMGGGGGKGKQQQSTPSSSAKTSKTDDVWAAFLSASSGGGGEKSTSKPNPSSSSSSDVPPQMARRKRHSVNAASIFQRNNLDKLSVSEHTGSYNYNYNSYYMDLPSELKPLSSSSTSTSRKHPNSGGGGVPSLLQLPYYDRFQAATSLDSGLPPNRRNNNLGTDNPRLPSRSSYDSKTKKLGKTTTTTSGGSIGYPPSRGCHRSYSASAVPSRYNQRRSSSFNERDRLGGGLSRKHRDSIQNFLAVCPEEPSGQSDHSRSNRLSRSRSSGSRKSIEGCSNSHKSLGSSTKTGTGSSSTSTSAASSINTFGESEGGSSHHRRRFSGNRSNHSNERSRGGVSRTHSGRSHKSHGSCRSSESDDSNLSALELALGDMAPKRRSRSKPVAGGSERPKT